MYPFLILCLLVSGGNTAIVLIESAKKFKILGSTIDDSAGECFDKVAKVMGLGYPGGPALEKKQLEEILILFNYLHLLQKLKTVTFLFQD